MLFVDPSKNKFYKGEWEVFNDYPHISFPMYRLVEAFEELGIIRVLETPCPTELINFYTDVKQTDPVFEDDHWVVKWITVPITRTPEEIAQENQRILTTLTEAIQEHLDTKVRERNYDGILSLCTYATSTVEKFRLEGQAGVNWRDNCWATAYHIMDEVLTGQRPIPTVEALLSELPVFIWPDEVVNG